MTLRCDQRAVIHVAEVLARCAPGKHRIRGPLDAVPLAREAVAALLLLPEGRALAREVLATDPLQVDAEASVEAGDA